MDRRGWIGSIVLSCMIHIVLGLILSSLVNDPIPSVGAIVPSSPVNVSHLKFVTLEPLESDPPRDVEAPDNIYEPATGVSPSESRRASLLSSALPLIRGPRPNHPRPIAVDPDRPEPLPDSTRPKPMSPDPVGNDVHRETNSSDPPGLDLLVANVSAGLSDIEIKSPTEKTLPEPLPESKADGVHDRGLEVFEPQPQPPDVAEAADLAEPVDGLFIDFPAVAEQSLVALPESEAEVSPGSDLVATFETESEVERAADLDRVLNLDPDFESDALPLEDPVLVLQEGPEDNKIAEALPINSGYEQGIGWSQTGHEHTELSDNLSGHEQEEVADLEEGERDTSSESQTGSPPQPKWTAPQLIKHVEPIYPSRARRLGIEGQVTLELDIDSEGVPVGVQIVISSGRLDLDTAAKDAVTMWRFLPALLGDTPTASTEQVDIWFRLR